MIIPAGVDVFKLAGFMVAALCIRSLKKKTLNLVGCVQRVAFFLVQPFGKQLEHRADVGAVSCSTLVDDFAEYQHLAGAEHIGGCPIEGAPIDSQAQIAFALSGEATN